jgi:large subunit ribosomal protein L18
MRTGYALQFKRKRKRVTNYRKRLKFILSGKPRLVVRKSLKHITAQIVKYSPEGDKVMASAHSKELEKYGWHYSGGNICAAYLTGVLLGKKLKKVKVDGAILDVGLNPSVKGSRVYALLKGVTETGFKVPASQEIFPSQERILGKHIVDYAEKLSSDGAAYKKQFSAYIKKKLDPKGITKSLEEVKKRILKNGKES